MAKQRFTTPVMRMVQGSVDEAQTKDQQGNPRVIKSGPNAGQPNPQYFLGGAVAKNDPAWPAFWELLCRQAFADFPNLFPHGIDAIIQAGGPQVWFTQPPQGHAQPWVMHPLFSFKVADGDGLDLLRELRQNPATMRIPVLLLSNESEVRSRMLGIDAGADEYIGKPYDLGQLVARALALLQPETRDPARVGHRVLVIDDSATVQVIAFDGDRSSGVARAQRLIGAGPRRGRWRRR